MCGIAGIITRQALSDQAAESVRRMNAALLHRGPDGEGHFRGSHVALAMRRLSIIDLQGGGQPLYNEDHSMVLIANGEIYNFIELRADLEARGHVFHTHSDCETIVHLYEQYGSACVQHLRGMFAFALWDIPRQKLILGRDRMGEKPLYIYEDDNALIFASEMKALLRSGCVKFELDAASINLYFHYGYVPEPATPLRGVRKLDAAHLLTVDVKAWQREQVCYWNMEQAPAIEGDPALILRRELEQVSELVVRSDVPVGVALSGGLDSSIVATMACRRYPGVMHAFSVGYSGAPSNDERADARALAEHLGMPFHEVEIKTPEVVEFFRDWALLTDDPIADITGFGYAAVMRLARANGVPVMLQGQGGDELFWGYPWMRNAFRESLLKDRFLHNRFMGFWQAVRLSLPNGWKPWQIRQWLERWCMDPASWERWRRFQDTPPGQMVFYDMTPDFGAAVQTARSFYADEFISELEGQTSNPAALFTYERPWPAIDMRLTRLICQTYLRENGVTQGDRLGMAASVELRLPLLDHKLVETVIGLRKTSSDAGLSPKAWLKSAVKDILPEWVINRPKKGFTPPVHEWQRELFSAYGGELCGGQLVAHRVLNSESARDLSKGDFPIVAANPLSFKALMLEHWCRVMSPLAG